MSPTIPPPLPYFQALPWEAAVSVSSAMTREKRESWRRMVRAWLNILEACSVDWTSATDCRSSLGLRRYVLFWLETLKSTEEEGKAVRWYKELILSRATKCDDVAWLRPEARSRCCCSKEMPS